MDFEQTPADPMNLLKEFKPSLLFLGKFLGVYFLGNILYGTYVEIYDNTPDPITVLVSHNTSNFLNNMCGEITATRINDNSPTVSLYNESGLVLRVFEGCNGINVMIVFVAFIIAFGGSLKRISWFVPVGIIILHVVNIFRLALLYGIAIKYSHYFYYFHKYLFTAAIYVIVFALWALWVFKFNTLKKSLNAEK